MAGYSAVIDLRVNGLDGLRTVSDRIESINRLIKQIKPVPTLFDARGSEQLKRAKQDLSDLVKKYSEGGTQSARFASSIAGLNQQLTQFRAVAANAKTGSDQFTNALKASEFASSKLAKAEMERLNALNAIYTRQATGRLTAEDQGPSLLTKEILAIGKTLPSSIAGLRSYGAELDRIFNLVEAGSVDFRALQTEIARVNRQLDIATGGGAIQGPELPPSMRGGRGGRRGLTSPIGGGPGFPGSPGARAAQMENLMLGAGFPLLFGGGAGQVAGGLLGSFVGPGFGGQILGSAIGQQLEDALRRISDIGKAAQELNLDNLRESVIAVNADLDVTVERLLRAGEVDAARAEIGRQVALQTGLLPEATQKTARAVDALGTAWNEIVGAVSGLLSLVGTDLVNGLAIIFQLAAKVVQLLNVGLQILRDWHPILRLISELQKFIVDKLPAVNEGYEAGKASLEKQTDEYQRQLELSLKLSRATELEKIRIEGNAKVEEKIAQARLEYRGQDTKLLEAQIRAQGELEMKEKEKLVLQKEQQEVNRKIKDQLSEMKTKYDEITSAAKDRIGREQAAVDRGLSVANARYNAEKALLDLDTQRLERAYDYAETEKKRYNIALALYKNEVAAAEIEYKQQLESIAAEERKLEIKIKGLKLAEQEAILLAKRAVIAAQEEKDPAVRAQRLDAIKKSANEYLSTSRQTIVEVEKQLEAQRQIGEYQRQAAEAQLQGKIEAAGMKLEQKLVSEEIGLSEKAARLLVTRLQNASIETATVRSNTQQVVGVIETATDRTVILANSMSDVAAQAHNAAVNIGNAISAQAQLNAMSSGGSGQAPQKFAVGGYVTGATNAVVGEAGPEYVIPAGKMDEAMSRYAAGQRGSSVIPSSISPQVNVTTGPVMNMNGSNYVSQQDFMAGLQTATRRGAELALSTLQKSNNARRAVGI